MISTYCGNYPDADHTGCPSSVECYQASAPRREHQFAVTVAWVDNDDKRQRVRTYEASSTTSQLEPSALREAIAEVSCGGEVRRVCLLNTTVVRTAWGTIG